MLMEAYISNPMVYGKPRWFVWSIQTTFMRYLPKEVTNTSSFLRKPTLFNNGYVDTHTYHTTFFWSGNNLWGAPTAEGTFQEYSGISPTRSGPDDTLKKYCYMKVVIFVN